MKWDRSPLKRHPRADLQPSGFTESEAFQRISPSPVSRQTHRISRQSVLHTKRSRHLVYRQNEGWMTPLTFEPILKRIRWGGRQLGELLGKNIGAESDYAESWELADHEDGQSVVNHGPLVGQTLQQLREQSNVDLFGRHAGLGQFPLLIKFLDANDWLSLQVHPNDEQAIMRLYQTNILYY